MRTFFNRLDNKGVSLIELMVAVSVFIILITIAIGSFIQSMKTQRITLALISVNDSVNLSIEQMAREIRTGYIFCTASIPAAIAIDLGCNNLQGDLSGDHELQFVNADGIFVRYRLNPATFLLEKGISDSICLGGLGPDSDGFCYRPITADNVKVARFVVKLNHADIEADPYSPLVTLIMSVTSKEPDVEPLNIFTDIQTSISPRCGQNGCPSDI